MDENCPRLKHEGFDCAECAAVEVCIDSPYYEDDEEAMK
jgi:hypothetical protein